MHPRLYRSASTFTLRSAIFAVLALTFASLAAAATAGAAPAGISNFTITATPGPNGQINPSGAVTVAPGATQVFSITPDVHYQVDNVVVDGVSIGFAVSYQFQNVQANHTLTASFVIDTYTIDTSSGPNGNIAPVGPVTVDFGGDQTFDFTPDLHYHVADVEVDGGSVGTPASYTFASVSANHSIGVTFAIDTYTLTPLAGTNGSIAPGSPVTAN